MPRPCPVCGCDSSTDERTLEQNKRLWAAYTQIVAGILEDAFERKVQPAYTTRTELHRDMLTMFLPDRWHVPGFPLSSTAMSPREFAKYTDDVVAFWASKGIYVLPEGP